MSYQTQAFGPIKCIYYVFAAILYLSFPQNLTRAAVHQLSSPSQINSSTIINFDDFSGSTVANTLYQDQGITFSRDDGEEVFIYNWIGKVTVSQPNILATVSVWPFNSIWATHLNVNSSSGLFAIGAYFGNDQNWGSDFTKMRLSAYDSSNSLLGSVIVYTNNNDSVDQFIGLQSDTPIFSVRFENLSASNTPTQYSAVCLDNLTFTSVPEPATMVLVGLGSIILRRRKH